MIFIKNKSPVVLSLLFLVQPFYAAVGILSGTISVRTNLDQTVSVSIISGKNFTVPATGTLTLKGFCAFQTGVLWQATVEVPVTFNCSCVTRPSITNALEISSVIPSVSPVAIQNITIAAQNVSANGFTLIVNYFISSCPTASVGVSEEEVIQTLNNLNTAVSFAVFCTK